MPAHQFAEPRLPPPFALAQGTDVHADNGRLPFRNLIYAATPAPRHALRVALGRDDDGRLLAVRVHVGAHTPQDLFETGFVRTPKYAIEGRHINLETKKYRRKSGWLPYVEIGIGTYFLGMVMYALETLNFLTIPFLLLFVGGYYWAGFATLYQEYQGRLRWMRQRRLELGTAR